MRVPADRCVHCQTRLNVKHLPISTKNSKKLFNVLFFRQLKAKTFFFSADYCYAETKACKSKQKTNQSIDLINLQQRRTPWSTTFVMFSMSNQAEICADDCKCSLSLYYFANKRPTVTFEHTKSRKRKKKRKSCKNCAHFLPFLWLNFLSIKPRP